MSSREGGVAQGGQRELDQGMAKTSPSFELDRLGLCCGAAGPLPGCSHALHSWKIIKPSASHCPCKKTFSLTLSPAPGKRGVPGETDTPGAGAGMGQHLHLAGEDRGRVSLQTARGSPPVLGVGALPAPEQASGEGEARPPLGGSGRGWGGCKSGS